ncbi:unnamed protein product [Orchesella dallaii]|uniref:Gustatory receptor n=1 Tax=Orchesella dallaii TaxID=48710 RepID=A0ABP1R2C8_9HEXA
MRDTESFRVYFLFALTVLWTGSSSSVLFLQKLWLIGYLKSLGIGALLLHQNLQTVTCPDELDMTLERFRELEFLTKEFNDAFGLIIAVGVLSLCLMVLISLFEVVLYVLVSDAKVGFTYVLPLFLTVWILFVICDAANTFEIQIKRCLSNLKEFPRKIPNISRMVSMQSLGIGALLLHQNLQAVSCPDELDMAVERFRELEFLTHEFNDAFGIIIAMGFLSLCLTVLISLFEVVLYVLELDAGVGFSYVLQLFLTVLILFVICDAANTFEIQIKRCLSNLKELPRKCPNISKVVSMQISLLVAKNLCQPLIISPGSLFQINRRTLTAIISTITTYMVVLVQFYKDG